MAHNGLSAAIEAFDPSAAVRDELAYSVAGVSFDELTAPQFDSQIALRERLRAHYGLASNAQLAAAVEARVSQLAAEPGNPLCTAIATGQGPKKAKALERALGRRFEDDREPVRAWRPFVERYASHCGDAARTAAVLAGLLALGCTGPQAFRGAHPELARDPNALARAVALLADTSAPAPGDAYQTARDSLALELTGGIPFDELVALEQPGLLPRLMGSLNAQTPWEATERLRDSAHLLAQDPTSALGNRLVAEDFGSLAKPLLALARSAGSAATLEASYKEWVEYARYLGPRPEAAPVRAAVLSGLLGRCATGSDQVPLLADEMYLKASVWDEGPLMYLGWAFNGLVPVAERAAVNVSAKQAYRYLACELMGKGGFQATVDSFVKYNYRFVVNDDTAKIRLEVRQAWGASGAPLTKEEALEGIEAVLADSASPYLRSLWERGGGQAWLGVEAPFDILACMVGYYRLRGYGSTELQALQHRFDRYRAEFAQTHAEAAARGALRLLLLSTMFGPGDDLSRTGTVGVERTRATALAWQVAEAEPDPRGGYRLADPTGKPLAELSRTTGTGGIATLFDEDSPFVIGRSVTADQERAGRGIAVRERRGADGNVTVPANLYSGTHAKLFFDEGQRLVLENASGALNVRLVRVDALTASATDLAPGQRALLEPGDVFVLSAGSAFARAEHRAIDEGLFRAYRVGAR